MLLFIIVLIILFIIAIYAYNPQISLLQSGSYKMCSNRKLEFSPINMKMEIDAKHYYRNYYGHPRLSLQLLHHYIRQHTTKYIVWLVGDSSLDNKYWLQWGVKSKPLPVYKNILSEPGVLDVCSQLNKVLETSKYVAVNCAIEESSLSDRRETNLVLAHDIIVQNNININDVLIVSVGGNDIALKPSFRTIFWMFLMYVIPIVWIPPHIYSIFHDEIKRYITRLIKHKKPKLIIVCMFYYPCIKGSGWASKLLNRLKYNNPTRAKYIHSIIDLIYETCIKQIIIDGVKVEYVHLGKVLDYEDESDYIACVEPSANGGFKMAKVFGSLINK